MREARLLLSAYLIVSGILTLGLMLVGAPPEPFIGWLVMVALLAGTSGAYALMRRM